MDWFRRFSRMFRIQLAAKRREPLHIHDVSIVHDRVWLTDIDELRHMNNGVYLSLLDHPRLDLMIRTGGWARMQKAGMYPVVTAQQVAYRKSLKLGQRFQVETKILGYDARYVYLEQRIVSAGELYARAFVQGRILRVTGGVVPMEDVGSLFDIDTRDHPVPAWLSEWSARIALPSTREAAPSDWS